MIILKLTYQERSFLHLCSYQNMATEMSLPLMTLKEKEVISHMLLYNDGTLAEYRCSSFIVISAYHQ